jgi:hypothetical protein
MLVRGQIQIAWPAPSIVPEMLSDKDPAKAKEVMHEILRMKNLDTGKIQLACQRVVSLSGNEC